MVSLIDTVGRYVAFPALLGIVLLVPLYVSQRRDIARLRAWREREPGHPHEDLVASEALLDRAEAELQALLAERGESLAAAAAPALAAPASAAAPSTPPAAPGLTPIPPARRVTGDRPALTRITVERAALEPHPRWRRLAATLTTSRALTLIAITAVILTLGALVASHELLDTGSSGGGGRTRPAGVVAPGQVTVAVLNGTSEPGLAATVGTSVRRKGFKEGTIATARRTYQQTVVMYGRGRKRAAEQVASVLGVTPVQPIDRTTRQIAGAADVVVIVGRDKARS